MLRPNHLRISSRVSIPLKEIELTAVRASGSGGQNVNKVSSAIHLRFDIVNSSLPDIYKTRLLKSNDKRISNAGILIIKAQNHRDQEKNRTEALHRLYLLLKNISTTPKKRIATKPTKASKIRRLESKKRQADKKDLRRNPLI